MKIVSWEFESPPLHTYFVAAIAQLVERDLAKVEVAGPSPVCRSSSNEKYNHEPILKIF